MGCVERGRSVRSRKGGDESIGSGGAAVAEADVDSASSAATTPLHARAASRLHPAWPGVARDGNGGDKVEVRASATVRTGEIARGERWREAERLSCTAATSGAAVPASEWASTRRTLHPPPSSHDTAARHLPTPPQRTPQHTARYITPLLRCTPCNLRLSFAVAWLHSNQLSASSARCSLDMPLMAHLHLR